MFYTNSCTHTHPANSWNSYRLCVIKFFRYYYSLLLLLFDFIYLFIVVVVLSIDLLSIILLMRICELIYGKTIDVKGKSFVCFYHNNIRFRWNASNQCNKQNFCFHLIRISNFPFSTVHTYNENNNEKNNNNNNDLK